MSSVLVAIAAIIGGIVIVSGSLVTGLMLLRGMIKWFHHLLHNYRNAPTTMVSSTGYYDTENWSGGRAVTVACGCSGDVTINWYPRERRFFSHAQLGWSVCGRCGSNWLSTSSNKAKTYQGSEVHAVPYIAETITSANSAQIQSVFADGTMTVRITGGNFENYTCEWYPNGTVSIFAPDHALLHSEDHGNLTMMVGDNSIVSAVLYDGRRIVFSFVFNQAWQARSSLSDLPTRDSQDRINTAVSMSADGVVGFPSFLGGNAGALPGTLDGPLTFEPLTVQPLMPVPYVSPLLSSTPFEHTPGRVVQPSAVTRWITDTGRANGRPTAALVDLMREPISVPTPVPEEPLPLRVRGRKLDLD